MKRDEYLHWIFQTSQYPRVKLRKVSPGGLQGSRGRIRSGDGGGGGGGVDDVLMKCFVHISYTVTFPSLTEPFAVDELQHS